VPVTKATDPVPVDAEIGDRRSLVFGGSLLTSGTGRGVVVRTGASTELGRISTLLRETPTLETPLTQSMATFGKLVALAILVVSLMLLGVGVWRGYDWIDAILAAITLAVAAIPEGLPAIITIALAIGVRRMAARRAIIRLLPAVETLGSTTVICSDKTGTLTKNEMTVVCLWVPGPAGESGTEYELTGVGYDLHGRLQCAGREVEAPESVIKLARAGMLCSDATLFQDATGRLQLTGDPTEAALIVAGRKLGLLEDQLRRTVPRLDVVPFESETRLMATLHPLGAEREILLKGAPEVVLPRCRWAGSDELAALQRRVEELARGGLRVLAFAVKAVPASHTLIEPTDLQSGFVLLGLQGMMDPPRPEAIEAIRRCREAGIVVKMITGDHPGTAAAIGKQLGLLAQGGQVVTGREIAAMSGPELVDAALHHHIFARVAPEHKLRLVEALQSQKHVVAMTGDGVNDAPALKRANIGVAMGITGTAVSKEAADIVLTDDNFASIVAAVEEGRRVYDNLIKSLAFVLPTNLGEALVILVAVLFFPIIAETPLLPVKPVQILWINLVATVALALPLAFEAPEPDVMRRRPRDPSEPLLSGFVLMRTVVVALLMTIGAIGLFLYDYFVELEKGYTPEASLAEAQTVAVTTIIMFQVFYLLNCRSLKDAIWKIGWFSNLTVFAGIGLILALQVGFVYLPFMNALFDSAPLPAWGWLKATLAGLVIVPVIAGEKYWRKRRMPPCRT
jgi:potassium/sodium efflux P-type ATPase